MAMWTQVWKTPWYRWLGLAVLGLDLGIWAGPHVPGICTADALLFLLATGVSLLATGAGLGGAVLMVPLLLLLRRLGTIAWPPTQIGALASLSAAVASGMGAHWQRRQGTVHVRLALNMGVVGSAMACAMAVWTRRWSIPAMTGVDLSVATVAVLFLWVRPSGPASDTTLTRGRTYAALIATAGIGLISGITGMPGSFLLIPALVWISRLPHREVVGTSLQAIFFLAATTFVMKLHQGFFNSAAALPLVAGSLVGSRVGSAWARTASPHMLRWLATTTILLGSLATLFF